MGTPENTPPLVLVVDDEPAVRGVLRRILAADGCDVVEAADGEAGIRFTSSVLPDLVILDQTMPGAPGEEVCRRIKAVAATCFVPVLMLTGSVESGLRVRAWEAGADEFLTKPASPAEIAARCRSLLRLKRAVDALDTAEAVLVSWARALEAKCPYTRGHSERVAAHAVALGRAAGFSDEELDHLRKGALLHDVGKLLVPDDVLNKPGRLTLAEVELIRRHPALGAEILAPLQSLRDAIPLVRWHHERLDGSGYPDGLRGPAIPPPVRALAVADVFDSLASDRPYRPALEPAKCRDILAAEARAGGLDADLVRVFIDLPPGVARAPVSNCPPSDPVLQKPAPTTVTVNADMIRPDERCATAEVSPSDAGTDQYPQ